MSDRKWMSSGFLQGAPVGEVDADRGVIEGVSVTTAGEAKGHGVHLDSEFVSEVVRMGNEKKQGLKARFGHPNMCSTALGTFIGRFKNFRQDGDQAKADLFLSNEAKDTPHGNLHDYVFGMAENEPDMFGTSIVFTPGQTYRRDLDTGEKVPEGRYEEDERNLSDELYVECDALHACDTVDEPAANDGLFSRFSQETISGQITEFLDLHPHVWKSISNNPSIVEALGRHGDKVDEFMNRYRDYREHQQEAVMDPEATSSEQLEAGATESPEVTEELETPAETEVLEEVEAIAVEEGAETPAEELSEAPAEVEATEPETFGRDEFATIVDEFGPEIAAQVVLEGGDYDTALKLHADALAAENEALAAENKELKSSASGSPAKVTEAPAENKAGLFKTGK